MSTFFSLKPFYSLKLNEKEKQSCLCIYYLNLHVILKSINGYQASLKLTPYSSLLTYLNKLKPDKTFVDARKNCITSTKDWLKTTSEGMENQPSSQGQLVLTFVSQSVC